MIILMTIKMIVAMDKNRGIGNKNTIPWKLSQDMKYFRNMTIGQGNNAIVMGKNTFLSINRVLPKRTNYVLSNSLTNVPNSLILVKTFDKLLLSLQDHKYDDIWIIGGQRMYNDFIKHKLATEIYITYIDAEYECDTFFPSITDDYVLSSTNTIIDNSITLHFKKYIYTPEKTN